MSALSLLMRAIGHIASHRPEMVITHVRLLPSAPSEADLEKRKAENRTLVAMFERTNEVLKDT